MGKISMIRKNATWYEKFLIFVFVCLSAILVPVGLGQYVLWAQGHDFSFPFMFMGVLLPFLMIAKLFDIARR